MTGYYIETGSVGWRHEGWNDSYYPEDLPEEWQFEFYTHLFRFVVLPSNEWKNASSEDVAQWIEEGGEEFRFFLLIDTADMGRQQTEKLLQVGSLLSDRLSGIVVMQDQAGLSESVLIELGRHSRVFIDSDSPVAANLSAAGITACWRPERKTEHAVVAILTRQQSENTRRLREYIELFLKQAGEDKELYLVFSGNPPAIQAMQDAQVIGQMLTDI